MYSREHVKTSIAIFLIVLWFFQWIIHMIAICYGRWKLKLNRTQATPLIGDNVPPGVSIIKPLLGIDPNIKENLESYFTMKYPTYNLIFCIESNSDPVIPIIEELNKKYPLVLSHICSGGVKQIGVNPKVNNMYQGYPLVCYDLILISDSGVKMEDDTLSIMVSELKEDTGLVHQMPFTCDRPGFSAILEKVYFGSQHAKIYLLADAFGINCVTGMSCLFRREVLEDSGGMKYLGGHLAEDYHLGKLFTERGWKTTVSSQTARQNRGTYSVSLFQARMMRWAKLRASVLPICMLLEPVSECLFLSLSIAWSCAILFKWSPVVVIAVHFLIWFILDYILIRTIQNTELPFSKLEYLVAWSMRELSSIYLQICAHTSPVLVWQDKQFVMSSDITEINIETKV